MQRRPNRVVLLSLIWACACVTHAAQSKPAASIAHGSSAAQDKTQTASAEASDSNWREMTWSEYYDDVMRNASRRNAHVIWINPPQVRTVPRTKPATTAPAPSPDVKR
jgi:hypothetical protein